MARRVRGEGTIYKEDHPTRLTKWRGEKTVVLPDGRRKRIVVRASSQDGVLTALKRRERQVQAANPEAERMTLNEYLDRWLAYKKPMVKTRTYMEYASTLRKARERIGGLKLARVTPTDIQDVLTAEANEGHHATAANVRRYLKQAFRQAEKWGLIAGSPVRNIDPVKVPAVKRAVLQPASIKRVLTIAKGRVPTYYPMMHTAIFTGLRIGELVALPWSNVTPTTVRVDRTASRHAASGFERPKTVMSNRVVPIAPTTYRVMLEGRRHAEASTWTFPSRTGTMLGMRNVHRAFDEVREEAKLDVKFHDLRRTAATLWALNGATPKMVQMLLGHSTPHLALAIYTDVMDDQMTDAALDPLSIGGGIGGEATTETGRQREGLGDGKPGGTPVLDDGES